MASTHRTAIVDAKAQLPDDIEIGPNCVIDCKRGPVRLGPGTKLIGNVYLVGPIAMGTGNVLYPNCCIGFEPQHRKFPPASRHAGVKIGDNNLFREGATIHGGTEIATTIGNNNLFMCNSHAGHDAIVHDNCILANGALLAGHVEMFDNVTLGGNAAIHQFCRLGRLSMMSGVIAVTQDVPPFCTAFKTGNVGSLNLVGLRRAGYREHIRNLHTAFRILFLSGHATRTALARMEAEAGADPLVREMIEFVRASKRGIMRHARSVAVADAME
jgi:UDP-N-acetylglucosamine acyltransferase